MSSYGKNAPTTVLKNEVPASDDALSFETRDTSFMADVRKIYSAQAAETNFRNLQNAFNDAVAAVKVSEPTRDTSQNQRARYERNYQNLRNAARAYVGLANARGIKVMLPKYLAPVNTSEQYEEFAPAPEPVANDSHIRARKAAEKSAGIKPGVPGTAAADSWINLQGKGEK